MPEPIGYAASCEACGYEWWLIHRDNLPMPLDGAVRIFQTARCPNCDNDGKGEKRLYWLNREPSRI